MRIFPLIAASLLAAAATAQCATLTVTGSGAPGGSLTISLDAAPRALAFLAVGETAGTTTINLGPVSFDLGLVMPFAPVPLGMTDATGSASLTFAVPANIPSADVFLQGLSAGLSLPPNFGLSVCTSNVVALHLGA